VVDHCILEPHVLHDFLVVRFLVDVVAVFFDSFWINYRDDLVVIFGLDEGSQARSRDQQARNLIPLPINVLPRLEVNRAETLPNKGQEAPVAQFFEENVRLEGVFVDRHGYGDTELRV